MEHQIVVAVNEPLQPRQVIRSERGRRLFVVRELTRDEYEVKRRENAAERERNGTTPENARWLWDGEPTRMNVLPGHPAEPPPNCQHFYLVRDV